MSYHHFENRRMIPINGIEVAAAIANNLDEQERQKLIDAVAKEDKFTAEQIIERMFVFESLAKLNDHAMQNIIRNVRMPILLSALRGTTSVLRKHFLCNMSARLATELKEELESMPPVPKHLVEASRKEVLKVAKQLVNYP